VRVLITGTSRGLGLTLARHLTAQQHTVIGCARTPSELVDERYEHVLTDVTDPQAIDALVQHVRTRYGGLDALVNNAGWARMLPVALTPVDTARRIMDTNFLSTFMFTRAALRLLRKSTAGRIVNISSIAVPLRLEGEALYAAAKSAVETFTRVTAKEVGPWGITCNAVGPSPVRTRLLEGVPAEKLQAIIDRQAIREWADPADVVNVIEFFLKPESRMVTGQVVYLGGFA
jgi:3-oxoacyl-[acyl-carrier protein] reductase